MADPAPNPSDDSNSSPQNQQNVEGNENQVIGKVIDGTAIGKIVGNVIYNYYYREEVKIPIDDSVDSAKSDPLPCPYRGLFHFGPGDAEYFFGRESFAKELVQATQTRTFIPLLGASGSGKSSVVLAGLVPKLQQAGHWQFTHFRPSSGDDPFHALALALVPLYTLKLNDTERIAQARQLAGYFRTGEVLLADIFAQIQQNYQTDRVLLIADQFEELYTLRLDEATRRKFLNLLLAGIAAPVDRLPFAPLLVATMRADFLGNALSYRPFADVLHNAVLMLGAMNRAELIEAIEQPAQMLGVTFADGLVKRILDDVEGEPGILPLLEFALTELWQRRSGKQLTHAAYEEIGEVQGALGRHADREYERLNDADRERVRRIFVQLVRPGEGAEDTRRISLQAELGEQNWSLVKRLADARLVVTSRNAAEQETVEVVHETLIRNWGELRGWMNSDRIFRTWQERLRGAMRQWQETQQDAGSLLRGAALAEAEEQLQQRSEDLDGESSFIRLSIYERELLQQAEIARKKRDTIITRRIVGSSLLAVVVSSWMAWMAWKQTRQAELNLADTLSASALSLVEKGKDLDAFVPAIKAGKILQNQQTSNPSGPNALQEVLNHCSESNRLEGHESFVRSVSFSPNGETLATSSDDKTIKLWNVDKGKTTDTLKEHENVVSSVSFSPNGKTLATGSYDGTTKLWNVDKGKATLAETLQGKGQESYVLSVSFSRDGKTLATGSYDGTTKLWNVDKGKATLAETLQGKRQKSPVLSVSFSRDGKLATGSYDGTIKLWNVDNKGKATINHAFKGHENPVSSVSFSRDGKLATGGYDGTIKLWNVDNKGKATINHAFKGHENPVSSVSFSRDGKTLATGSYDKKIKLWNVDNKGKARLADTLKGHENTVLSVSFSRDGKLATGGGDGITKLWNVDKDETTHTLKGHESISSMSFGSDGKALATGSYDGTIKLWNVDNKGKATLADTLGGKGHEKPVLSMSLSRDGKTLATGSDDGTIKLWNVDNKGKATLAETRKGHEKSVLSMSLSRDGKLATGGDDGTINLWNVDNKGKATLAETIKVKGHKRTVSSMSFSPNGKTLATGSDDGTIKLWNVDNKGKATLNRAFKGHKRTVSSVSFSRDGKTLATGSYDQTIKLWNVDNGWKIRILQGQESTVDSVSFSPNGKTLATGSGDGTIKLWNVDNGWKIRTLQGQESYVLSVSFSRDGKTLATGSYDGTIKLWNNLDLDLDLNSLMGRSCDWARDYLENNINVSESDKRLCDGIGTKKQ